MEKAHLNTGVMQFPDKVVAGEVDEAAPPGRGGGPPWSATTVLHRRLHASSVDLSRQAKGRIATSPRHVLGSYPISNPVCAMRSLLTRLLGVFVLSTVLATTVYSADSQKSILVTGATSGIGRNLAESLAAKGHHVYAGARTDAEMAELNAIPNITAVRLDVTKQDQIDDAVQFIRGRGTGLYALVNNAGIYDGGPVLETEIEVQNLVYRVNVEGVLRTTRAFAPLVLESRGRIATTGSIAGTVAGPGFAAYSGSKHYIEAFTDALAAELEPLGVSVSVIEPGNYQTQIRRSSMKRSMARTVAAGGVITSEMERLYKATEERELSYKKPDEVTEAYEHALFSDEPLRRYVVVPNEQEQEYTIETKIRELVELNQWGPFAYSEEELLERVEAALAR